MNQKAQSGLEYLMTYGWALVIIASVVGVLVFIINPTSTTASFSSSDPSKIMLKGSSITENTASLVLQNITGGKITINSITFSGDIADTLTGYTLNRQTIDPATDFPLELTAGSEILLENLAVQKNGENSSIFIEYTDATGLDRKTEIKSGNGGPPGLVAAYWFNEGTGTETADESGNKNTLSIGGIGTNIMWDNGINGKGLNYLPSAKTASTPCPTGAYQNITSSNPIYNLPQDKFTFTTWLKITASGAIVRFQTQCYMAGCCSGFWIRNYGSYVINNSGENAPIATNVPADNSWHHFAYVFNLPALTHQTYVDGKLYQSASNLSGSYGNISKVNLGIYNTSWCGSYHAMTGLIDSAKIFNRALTAEEIQAEYNSGK